MIRPDSARPIRVLLASLLLLALAAGCGTAPARHGDGAHTGPTRETLANGLRLIMQDHRAADVVAIYLWVGVGGRDEAPDQVGYSHFQEHMLFKGTDRWGPGHIDRAVEGVGGKSNAVTSFDYSTFYVVVPSDAIEMGLGLLSDMAFRSIFDPKELDREREVIFEEARIETDNPRVAIVRQLYGLVFADHPYGRPILGHRETMSAGTRERVRGYYARHYTPENMAVVVVGPIEPAAVRAAVQRTFGRAPATGYRRAPGATPAPLTARISRNVDRPEQQAVLGLGWQAPRTDNPESFAVDLLVSVLGGTESSRLVRRLRDEERLVSSLTMSYAALQHAGIVTIRAELEPRDLEKVERLMLDEIGRLQRDGVTEEERQKAVIKAEADHAFDTETSEGLANAYGLAEITWALEEELRYVDRLRAVTREQIQEAARKFLTTAIYARLAFVPRKTGAAR
jgi:zinc protease